MMQKIVHLCLKTKWIKAVFRHEVVQTIRLWLPYALNSQISKQHIILCINFLSMFLPQKVKFKLIYGFIRNWDTNF